MATLVYSLSSKTDKVTGLHEVLIRFFHGRLNQRAKSGIFISAEYWNDELQRNFVPKFRLMNDQQRSLVEELTQQNEALQKLSTHIHKSFIEAGAGKDPLPKDWLVATVDMYMNPPSAALFEKAGLTRILTVVNPKTREEEKKRLCDIASSHLARRTFIGNLYKETSDPNIIGKLSGHKEGSRAFARYRR